MHRDQRFSRAAQKLFYPERWLAKPELPRGCTLRVRRGPRGVCIGNHFAIAAEARLALTGLPGKVAIYSPDPGSAAATHAGHHAATQCVPWPMRFERPIDARSSTNRRATRAARLSTPAEECYGRSACCNHRSIHQSWSPRCYHSAAQARLRQSNKLRRLRHRRCRPAPVEVAKSPAPPEKPPEPPKVEKPPAPTPCSRSRKASLLPRACCTTKPTIRYLVSNIDGKPDGVDNNGYITELSPDGKVVKAKFIAGGVGKVKLDAPKGTRHLRGVCCTWSGYHSGSVSSISRPVPQKETFPVPGRPS